MVQGHGVLREELLVDPDSKRATYSPRFSVGFEVACLVQLLLEPLRSKVSGYASVRRSNGGSTAHRRLHPANMPDLMRVTALDAGSRSESRHRHRSRRRRKDSFGSPHPRPQLPRP